MKSISPPYIHFKNEEIDEQSKAEVDAKVPHEVKIIRNMSGWFELLTLHPDPEENEHWKEMKEVVNEAFEKYLSEEDKEEYKRIYNTIFE